MCGQDADAALKVKGSPKKQRKQKERKKKEKKKKMKKNKNGIKKKIQISS